VAAAPIVGSRLAHSAAPRSRPSRYKPGVSLQSYPVERVAARSLTALGDFAAAAVVVIAPLLLVAFIAGDVWNWHRVPRTPVDFHIFWTAGQHYLHRQSPYGHSLSEAFVYPPPAALLFAPLAVLPYHVAAGLFLVASLAAVILGLWLAGVRDRRVYAAAFVSPAVLTALTIGTITPLLLLGLAAVWHFRNKRRVAVAAALLMVFKLFLWPVLIWLLWTRRQRAAFEAVALSVLLTIVSWAWVGFADVWRYSSILDHLAGAEGAKSYSLASGRAGQVLVAAAVVASLWFGRRLGERRLFALAITGALLASPIVWLHYFALVTAVLAVLEAPLAYWLIPALLWVTPLQQTGGETWRVLVALGVCVLSLFAGRSRRLTEGLAAPSRRGAGISLPPA
jgi:alpha-1,2-mannosyltransferase